MIHTYLFFIKNGEIRTYQHKNGSFYLVKYKGEESCSIKDGDFWPWWESSISFIPTEDEVDFCFVGENIEEVYHGTYSPVEVSGWNVGKIEDFLGHYMKDANIQITSLPNSDTLHITKAPQHFMVEERVELSYFTIPRIVKEEVKPKVEESHEQNLRNYFLKELQKIN